MTSCTTIVLVGSLPMLLLAVLSTVDDTTIDPCTRSTKLRTALRESGVTPETDFRAFRLRLNCSCRTRVSILAFRLCCGHTSTGCRCPSPWDGTRVRDVGVPAPGTAFRRLNKNNDITQMSYARLIVQLYIRTSSRKALRKVTSVLVFELETKCTIFKAANPATSLSRCHGQSVLLATVR